MTKTIKTATKTNNGFLAVTFTKMTGAGNDFLIFDAREKGFPKFDRALFSKSLCRRSLSVGADGVVFIEKTKTPHVAFKWDFYNADGSRAEMCGNAARCVARYALEHSIGDKNMSFETAAGIINTRVRASGIVEVEMTKPEIYAREMEVPLGEHLKVKVMYMNSGVPHVVLPTDDWSQEHLFEMGRFLRNHDLFKKTNGANVTFYEKNGEQSVQSATYERGVEDVTLACGTGAVAAATASVLEGMKSPIEVHVPGGTLHVAIGEGFASAQLAGEARFICEGNIMPEALL